MTVQNHPKQIETYLFLDGRCEEAINFYRQTLGAQVDMMLRLKDSPEPARASCAPAGADDKIMHASIRIGATRLMLSDGQCKGQPNFQGFSLSIAMANEAEVKSIFTALSDGGKVCAPLTKTFFSPSFGMVTDRFGVTWMVLVEQH